MVVISLSELRKRAEHNEGRLEDLEEVSLHQLNVKKIENLDKFCRNLKILYLQDNAICKLENLRRLKKLEYLNISMNAIERIEGLESCESLRKLDLTLNFIGEITSAENLRENVHLEQIFLTGNPCTLFKFYREFIIHTLPSIRSLDGKDVERRERILAEQNWTRIRTSILQEEDEYKERRKIEKDEYKKVQEKRNKDLKEEDVVEWRKKFFEEKSSYTPESRLDLQAVLEQMEQEKEEQRGDRIDETKEKKKRNMFMLDGRPYSINEPRLGFTLQDESSEYRLNVEVYRYTPTESLNLDIQPNYVRLHLGKKLFQLRLEEEIKPDSSSAQRSQTTGFLLIILPKASSTISATGETNPEPRPAPAANYLEVDSRKGKNMDFSRIYDPEQLELEDLPDLEYIGSQENNI